MKVLQINAVNLYGSTGRNCFEIAKYLNENGHECYTAYSIGAHTDKSIRISSTIECKIHAFLSRLFGLQGYYSFFSTKKAISIIKNLKPDIVHLNNLHSNYVNVNKLLKYLIKHDIATVLTLHDCWFYTGKCTSYTDAQCNKWKTGCSKCPKLKYDNISWFFDRTKKMWKDKRNLFRSFKRLVVIGVSNWLTNEVKQSFLSVATGIYTIYNWIDFEIFKPCETNVVKERLKLCDYKIILGVSSYWNDGKGLAKFIELSKLLADDERIVLVGKMPNINLPQNIISIPSTDEVFELVQYYNMADVFLQLSEAETFGKVVAEALACGTPVITNNKTANPEIIGDSCGIILNNLNVDMIYDAIKVIFSEGKAKYSKHCISFAKSNFDKNENIKRYIEVYESLLNRRA